MATSDAIASLSTILTEGLSLIKSTLDADRVNDLERESKLTESSQKINELTASLEIATRDLANSKTKLFGQASDESITNLTTTFKTSLTEILSTAQQLPSVAETATLEIKASQPLVIPPSQVVVNIEPGQTPPPDVSVESAPPSTEPPTNTVTETGAVTTF